MAGLAKLLFSPQGTVVVPLPWMLQGVVLADPSAVTERLPPTVAFQQMLAPCDIAARRPQPLGAQDERLVPGCLNLQVAKVVQCLQWMQLELAERLQVA